MSLRFSPILFYKPLKLIGRHSRATGTFIFWVEAQLEISVSINIAVLAHMDGVKLPATFIQHHFAWISEYLLHLLWFTLEALDAS
ncbi:hypothetical protein CHS0354_036802, partial [Potamilus streckersoni]